MFLKREIGGDESRLFRVLGEQDIAESDFA